MTATGVRHPFRFPSWREHLADLRGRPEALMALVHNALPVVGIFALGWSLPLVVFTYWFDGFAGLAVILALIIPKLMREVHETRAKGIVGKAFYGVFSWLVLVIFMGIPYWIVLIPLGEQITSAAVLAEIRSSPDVWGALAFIVGGHVVAGLKRGYDALPEKELRQALRWDVYLLILRAIAMFVVAANVFPLLVVPALALVFTYMEIWPANTLGIVFGDPARLHEYETAGGHGAAKPQPRQGKRKRRLPR